MGRVNQAKAAQQLHENYFSPDGRIRGTASGVAGDLPSITEAGFARGSLRGEANYSPEALAHVDAIQNAIRSKNLIQRVKSSGTGGGGSATAPTQFAAADADSFAKAAANAIRSIPVAGKPLMGLYDAAGQLANVNRDRMLSDADCRTRKRC